MKRLMIAVVACIMAMMASASLDLTIGPTGDDGLTAGQRLTNAVIRINAAGGGKLTLLPGTYDVTGLYMNTNSYAVKNDASKVVNYKEHLVVNNNVAIIGDNDVHWDGGDGQALSATAVIIKGDGRFLRASSNNGAKFYNLYFANFTGALDHPECVPASGNLENYSLGGVLNLSGANDNNLVSNCVFIGNSCRSAGAISQGKMIDCYFKGNYAEYAGGVTRNPYMKKCKVVENYSASCDGAIWFANNVYDTYFEGNHANERGVLFHNSTCVISNCVFVKNYSTYATVANLAKCRMYDCVFSNNYNSSTVSDMKIGCLTLDTDCKLYGCTFIGNSATNQNIALTRQGAAVYSGHTEVSKIPWLYNCVFSNNVVNSNGGAVYGCSVSNCTFIGNAAGYNAGAYCPLANGTAIDCRFVANRVERSGKTTDACRGGAIKVEVNSVTISNCVFVNNAVYTNGYNKSHGGAIATMGGSAKIIGCAFTNNYACSAGGAFYDDDDKASHATIQGCDFYTNVCYDVGGAVSGGIVTNCTFIMNNAGGSGGALHLTSLGRVYDSTFQTNFVTGNAKGNIGGGAIGGTTGGGATVRIRGCTFIGNYLKGSSSYNFYGGAFNDSGTGGCKVHDSIFIDNHSYKGPGGACYGGGYSNCWFIGNCAYSTDGSGGALCGKNWPGEYVLDCHFISNHLANASTGYGVAYYSMLTSDNDKLKITNEVKGCTFAYNWINNNRPIVAFHSTRTNVLENCWFGTNLVHSTGVIANQILSNCTFVGNIVPFGSGVVKGCKVLKSTFRANSRFDTHFNLYSKEAKLLDRNHIGYGGTDGYYSDFYDCDFSEGGLAFQGCTLNRCVIHDITKAQSEATGTFCMFFGGNHVTNTLVKDCHLWYTAALGLFYTPSATSLKTANRFNSASYVNCTFRDYSYNGGDGNAFCYSIAYDANDIPTLALNSIFINGKNVYNAHREICSSSSATLFSLSNCVVGCACFGAFNQGFIYMPKQNLGGVILDQNVEDYKFVDNQSARYNGAAKNSLRPRSPYRDLGDASVFTATDTDLAGNLRLRNNKVDLGAYECWISRLGTLIFAK